MNSHSNLLPQSHGRNPWMTWRFVFGTVIEWWHCRRYGHVWAQFYIAGTPCRYDGLGYTWLTCCKCAQMRYFYCDEWDALNTPLHQAIRKAL